MCLKDKTVFLTGGAGGIGKAFVVDLLKKGCQICITDVNYEAGVELERELRKSPGVDDADVVFLQCDVTNEENFRDVFRKAVAMFGHIDVMLNNAGVMHEGRWDDTISVCLRGTVIGTNLAVAHMRKDKGGMGGVIINTASCCGVYVYFSQPVYCAAKSGVVAHTRAWSKIPDRVDLGLRFGCICPEPVDTPLMDVTPDSIQYFHIENDVLERLGRIKPERISEGLVSLLEDDDSNGAILYISKEEGLVRMKILVVNESDLSLV